MDFRVRFRFNKTTGEVEIFEVSDEGTRQLDPEHHDRHHDEITGDLARLIDRDPEINEILPGAIPIQEESTVKDPNRTDETLEKPQQSPREGRKSE